MIKRIFLFIMFSFFCIENIYGDEFFESGGDVSKNMYFDTLTYSIGKLEESRKCPNCVEYDIKDVKGSSSSEVQNVNISDLTYVDSKYGLVRKSGIYDTVALPVYSSVDFIYFGKNTGQESVYISDIKVSLSRSNVSMGNVVPLLYIDGIYEDIKIKYIGYSFYKSGINKSYLGVGEVSSNQESGAILLERILIKPELSFVKWEAQINDGKALMRVYVKNISDRLLNNVVFTHREYSNSRDFLPYQEYVYEYILDVEDESNLGYAGIYDSNTKQECVVMGEDISSIVVGSSAIVSGVRKYNGVSLPYVSSRSKPWGESFCITRIPYTMYSGEMLIVSDKDEVDEEIDLEEEVTIVKEDIDITQVLGIEKLPQTNKNGGIFLVVFSILWYYLLRKIYI